MSTESYRVFEEAGERVRQAWKRSNFNHDRFPQIAADGLRDFALPSDWTIEAAALYAVQQRRPPPKLAVNFGDVNIRVFECAEFFIEVLVWLDGTTTKILSRIAVAEMTGRGFSFGTSADAAGAIVNAIFDPAEFPQSAAMQDEYSETMRRVHSELTTDAIFSPYCELAQEIEPCSDVAAVRTAGMIQ